ncbi:hypothetical protein H3H54_01800 [Brachybacterium sp. Z12]|uniref:glycosyltransferase n=1 Tax=Brachybacterium sp. Z12 TaxID=2759167 RepID=UPI00185FC004|nr:glycosyltransferase [Brachybacterium sp. Z12]QNN82711.1 hypothetical protein H3H54_01800 [Brachybacterium sp. Z12]
MTTRVFVTVGTDHHPFTRLIEWVDHWSASHDDLELVVQHGTARPSRHGVNHELLGSEEIAAQYAAADLVVSQVGPGTIADANRAGHRPIVVPRDPHLGEVVDDHQVAFGDFMASRGRCVSVRTREHLVSELDAWLAAPKPLTCPSALCPQPPAPRSRRCPAPSSAPRGAGSRPVGCSAPCGPPGLSTPPADHARRPGTAPR